MQATVVRPTDVQTNEDVRRRCATPTDSASTPTFWWLVRVVPSTAALDEYRVRVQEVVKDEQLGELEPLGELVVDDLLTRV